MEGLGDAVLGEAVVVEEVVFDDQVIMRVEHVAIECAGFGVVVTRRIFNPRSCCIYGSCKVFLL